MNTSIWKDKIRNSMFIQIGIEFQCLEGEDKNSNVSNDKTIIPVLIEVGPEFNSFQG